MTALRYCGGEIGRLPEPMSETIAEALPRPCERPVTETYE